MKTVPVLKFNLGTEVHADIRSHTDPRKGTKSRISGVVSAAIATKYSNTYRIKTEGSHVEFWFLEEYIHLGL